MPAQAIIGHHVAPDDFHGPAFNSNPHSAAKFDLIKLLKLLGDFCVEHYSNSG